MNVIVIFFPIELLYSNSVVWQNRIELMYICNTDERPKSLICHTYGREDSRATNFHNIYIF